MPQEMVVWIFGAGRTGSTWLARMLTDQPGAVLWNEPYVGSLFAGIDAGMGRLPHRPETIFGQPHKDVWRCSVRTRFFVNAEVRFPHLGPDSLLVVKEPGGSLGAPTLSEAFPESRLVLLVRDPRDVVASILDSVRPGGFREALESGEDPDELATKRSRIYLRSVQAAARAFDAHVGPKSLVRYEQLRSDALGSMRRGRNAQKLISSSLKD